MIQLPRFIYFISFLLFFSIVNAQEEIDSLEVKKVYGLRVGADITKPAIAMFDSNYDSGFEIVGDLQFKTNLFAAVELGFDNKTIVEDYLNFTTKGSYLKIGANYNAYKNWIGMTNEIYIGFRYGISLFNHTLNSYKPNIKDTYFISEEIESNTKFDNLNAHWAEFQLGIKTETFKNFYFGFSLAFKIITSNKDPDNFQNLYIPGFNKVSLNNMGFGFNYTLSYLIPIVKKSKWVQKK